LNLPLRRLREGLPMMPRDGEMESLLVETRSRKGWFATERKETSLHNSYRKKKGGEREVDRAPSSGETWKGGRICCFLPRGKNKKEERKEPLDFLHRGKKKKGQTLSSTHRTEGKKTAKQIKEDPPRRRATKEREEKKIGGIAFRGSGKWKMRERRLRGRHEEKRGEKINWGRLAFLFRCHGGGGFVWGGVGWARGRVFLAGGRFSSSPCPEGHTTTFFCSSGTTLILFPFLSD